MEKLKMKASATLILALWLIILGDLLYQKASGRSIPFGKEHPLFLFSIA